MRICARVWEGERTRAMEEKRELHGEHKREGVPWARARRHERVFSPARTTGEAVARAAACVPSAVGGHARTAVGATSPNSHALAFASGGIKRHKVVAA